jgi:hypothetical protein
LREIQGAQVVRPSSRCNDRSESHLKGSEMRLVGLAVLVGGLIAVGAACGGGSSGGASSVRDSAYGGGGGSGTGTGLPQNLQELGTFVRAADYPYASSVRCGPMANSSGGAVGPMPGGGVLVICETTPPGQQCLIMAANDAGPPYAATPVPGVTASEQC